MLRKSLICGILLFTLGSAVCAAAPRGYAVVQTFGLEQEKNGVKGEMQLLVDSRLTPDIREKMWGVGDWSFVFSPGSKPYSRFSELPPANAKLQITDVVGKLIVERLLDAPLAKLEEFAAGGNNVFLLTVDYSVGYGSYAGPGTSLLRVSEANFHDVDALDPATQQRKPIRLLKALKSDWRMTTDSNVVEILSFTYGPAQAAADNQQVLTFTHYSFDGKQWLLYVRQQEGYWDTEQPFPPRSLFP